MPEGILSVTGLQEAFFINLLNKILDSFCHFIKYHTDLMDLGNRRILHTHIQIFFPKACKLSASVFNGLVKRKLIPSIMAPIKISAKRSLQKCNHRRFQDHINVIHSNRNCRTGTKSCSHRCIKSPDSCDPFSPTSFSSRWFSSPAVCSAPAEIRIFFAGR